MNARCRVWITGAVLFLDATIEDIRLDLSHIHDSPLHQHDRANALERELAAVTALRAELHVLTLRS